MSPFSRSFQVAAAFAVFAMSSAAQAIRVGATIPFEFEISNASMPAGDYRVVRDIPGLAILIYSMDSRHQAVAIPSRDSTAASDDAPVFKLVFVRYQNGQQTRSFLRSVWYGWNGIELAQSRAERDTEAGFHVAAGTRTEVVLCARNVR
jgi:hypothetical protein